MKRVFAALAVAGVFGAGYIAGSINSFPTAHAQYGGAGAWPAAAAASSAGSTHFYTVDTGTRTLIWCKSDGSAKPSCVREPLP